MTARKWRSPKLAGGAGRKAAATLALFVALAVGGARPADAQTSVHLDCDLDAIRTLTPTEIGAWLPRHPDSVYAHMRDRIEAGEWLVVIDSIIVDFDADVVVHDTTLVPLEARLAYRLQLSELRNEIASTIATPDAQARRERAEGVRLDRFAIDIGGDPEEEEATLFLRYSTPVTLDAATPSTARRSLCWRALAVNRLLTAYGSPALRSLVQELQLASSRWDNYMDLGYSQFPWELWLNGRRFDATRENPPRSQLILLHPAAGIELVAPRLNALDELCRSNSFTVEPFGYVWYNDARSFYLGLSAAVSLTSDMPAGVGGIAHLGTWGHVGYMVRRHGSAGQRQDGLLISLDLYQLLSGTPARLKEARAAALDRIRLRHTP